LHAFRWNPDYRGKAENNVHRRKIAPNHLIWGSYGGDEKEQEEEEG
jgi:hypothetical protein